MRRSRNHRQLIVLLLLCVVTCTSLALLAFGVAAAALREILAIVFPPLAALAACAVQGERSGRG